MEYKTQTLIMIIRDRLNDNYKRKNAAKKLRLRYGFENDIDEKALMKKIALIVLANPDSLDMGTWHDSTRCGTTHCIGGWACVLSPEGKKIEDRTNTQIAAHAILPLYSHLFYMNKIDALHELKEIAEENT